LTHPLSQVGPVEGDDKRDFGDRVVVEASAAGA
jgi:hypothetical protein